MQINPRSARRSHLSEKADFLALYEDLSEEVLGYFARRVFEPEVAVDLTAETFAQAFHSRNRYRGTSDSEAAGWLFAIARHQLAAYIRRGRAELHALEKMGIDVPALTQADLDRVEELADLQRLREQVDRGMGLVSPDHREALELRVVDELPYREVADRLGVSEQTARARVSRGLRALLSILEPDLPVEENS